MASEPVPAAHPAEHQERRPRVGDRLADLVRIYPRAFLSQGAGLVGLAWCLDQNLPWVAGGLTALVLADQAIFLRGRPALMGAPRLQTGLDLWCLGVSCADLMLFFATVFRATGLREAGGLPVTDPLSCLAFAVAALARLDLGLAPLEGGGRLAAALLALLGDVALVVALAGALRYAVRRGSNLTGR